MSVIKYKPFFIIGSPRSGTSLLSRMINHHPAIAVRYETRFIKNLSGFETSFGDLRRMENRLRVIDHILSLPTVADIRPKLEEQAIVDRLSGESLAEMMDATLSAWSAQRGKRRWGEKSNNNALYWSSVADWFPDSY